MIDQIDLDAYWKATGSGDRAAAIVARNKLLQAATEARGADAATALGRALDSNWPAARNAAAMDQFLDKSWPAKTAPTGPLDAAPTAKPLTGGLGGRADLPPGEGRVWLQGDLGVPLKDADIATLSDRDRQVEALNVAHFNVDPNLAWWTTGAKLKTGTDISKLADSKTFHEGLANRLSILVGALTDAIGSSGEQIIRREGEPLKDAGKRVSDNGAAFKVVSSELGKLGEAANAAFHEMRGAQRGLRMEIGKAADRRASVLNPIGSGGAIGAGAASKTELEKTLFGGLHNAPTDLGGKLAGAKAAVEALGRVAGTVGSPDVVGGVTGAVKQGPAGAPERYKPLAGSPPKGAHPMSAAPRGGGTPGRGTPSPGKEAPGGSPSKDKPSSKPDLGALLSALGGGTPQQATPQQQMPTMPQSQMPQLGQQNPLAQVNPYEQRLQELLNGVKPEAEKKPDVDKPQFDSTPAGKAAEKDAPAPGSPIGTATPASPNGDPKTGEQPRKHQLDSTGTPVDRNKDGKVDKGAIPMSELTRRPFEMRLDVSPDLSIKLDDARLGEVMLNLEDGTPDDPKSVIEALREAGINVDELGDEVDPKDIRNGDTVVSEKGSGMYIGDDKVLMGTGEVKPLQELLDANGKVYETPLPDLPKEVDLTQDQRDSLTAHDNGQARPNDQHQVPAVDPATGKPIGEQGAVGGDQPAKPAGDGGQGGGQQPQQGQQELGEDGKPKPPPGAPAPGEPGGPAAGEQPSTPPAQQTQTDTAAKPDSGGSQPGAGQPAQQPNAPVAGPPPSSAYVPQGDDAKVQPQQPAAEQPKESDGPQQRPFRGYAVE